MGLNPVIKGSNTANASAGHRPLAVSSSPHLLETHCCGLMTAAAMASWDVATLGHGWLSWHCHGRLRGSPRTLAEAVPLLMAVVALLLKSSTPATSRPRTNLPHWVSRPVALPRCYVLWPRPLRTTRPRLHVLAGVRSQPRHTRVRWWSTRGLGPRHTASGSQPRTLSPIPPMPHHLETHVPARRSPCRSHELQWWLTHPAPEEQVAQTLYPPPRSRQQATTWASHGNCMSQFPLMSSGRCLTHSPLQAWRHESPAPAHNIAGAGPLCPMPSGGVPPLAGAHVRVRAGTFRGLAQG